MKKGRDIRQTRTLSRISGALLAQRAGVHRSRLSEIENELVTPTDQEIARIEKALESLLDAKAKVTEVAVRVGWPL